jgi:hypothetical protein
MVGMIDCSAANSTRYAGREAHGVSERLKRLKQADDWPQVPVFSAEGEAMQPERAAGHGAVVAVESSDKGARGVSLAWGVFLPVSEAACLLADVSALCIMLHGYFFVDSGRRYVEGFSSDLVGTGTGTTRTVYQQWNETLRDDLVLPLLPGVLHDALQQQMLTSAQLAELTTALRRSLFGRQHRAAIAARDVLARSLKSAERGAGHRNCEDRGADWNPPGLMGIGRGFPRCQMIRTSARAAQSGEWLATVEFDLLDIAVLL